MKKITFFLLVLLAFKVTANAQQGGWSIQTSPTTQNLYGVANSSVNTWVAVGGTGTILRSSDGGINWTSITSPVTDALRGVALRGTLGLAVGIAGRVVRSTDGGLSWVQEPRPTTRDLYSVAISDVSAIITGHEGTILVSTDNGLTWAIRTAGTASILFGVSSFHTTAVGAGGQGAIIMSVDGGGGWGLILEGNQLTFFYGASFPSATTGWVVGTSSTIGSIVIKSTNAGFVWTAQTAPTTDQLFGVSFAVLDTGTAVGGTGTIIHTSNGGNNWVSQTSGTTQILNGVSFANSNLGIAVGNAGTILRTSNGGLGAVRKISNEVPVHYSLQQNFPNPFNPATKIRYEMPKSGSVKLVVFDMLGKEITTLVNEKLEAGTYETTFDASQYPSGVYFYRLTTDGFNETKKMIVLK